MIKRFLTLILIFCWTIFQAPPSSSENDPKNTINLVVLDAGHGGVDPGAVGRNSREKDITLAITMKAGKYIQENLKDVRVIFTRDKDVAIPLHERADIANTNHADLFISIHVNSFSNNRTYGTETFTLGERRNEANLQVAMKENQVITMEDDYTTQYEGFDPTSAESYIIFNLMQTTYLEQSLQCATFVQEQFTQRAKRYDRGVKQDIFLVLWRTTMPSILIETGFLTNSAEEKFLMSRDGQDIIASAIYRAFKAYKEFIENRSVNTEELSRSVKEERELGTLTGQTSDASVFADEKIHFMVQILTAGKQISLDDKSFRSFGHVSEFKSGNYYKYAVGNATSYQSISLYLKEVREDFPDAFIIAVEKGQIIPLADALKK